MKFVVLALQDQKVLKFPSPPLSKFQGCDFKFISTTDPASKNGSFIAPMMINPDMHVRQCTYSFLAADNERVEIEFDQFDLDGTPPE